MGVEHALDIGGGDLRRKSERVHKELADGRGAGCFAMLLGGSLSVFITFFFSRKRMGKQGTHDNFADVVANAVQHPEHILDRSL